MADFVNVISKALSNEIINVVINCVDFQIEDMMNFTRVDSNWRSLILHKTVWSKRFVIFDALSDTEMNFEDLFRVLKSVLQFFELRKISLPLFRISLLQCSQLGSLTLDSCFFDWNQLFCCIQSLEHLRTLRIDAGCHSFNLRENFLTRSVVSHFCVSIFVLFFY